MSNKKEVNTTINGYIEIQEIDIYNDPELNKLVYNGLNGNATSFAEIIYYFYENEYMYGEDKNWYMYRDHRWRNVGDRNSHLRVKIYKQLTKVYSELYNQYKKNDSDKETLKHTINIINRFDGIALKNSIMNKLTNIYSVRKNPNKDFLTKLDKNNYLIGFDNGVFDLKTFEFREGKPTDYISMSTGYNYNGTHTDKYNNLLKFLEDIQPNDEDRDYLLTYLSTSLVGNLLEQFTIFIGDGRNGESKLVNLVGSTFGEYRSSMAGSLLTMKKPKPCSTGVVFLHLAKKRIVTTSGSSKNDKLNNEFINFLISKESIILKKFNSSEMAEFQPKFNIMLNCNNIPKTLCIDKSFTKKLRCINFPTEFVDDPKTENQRKIDVFIDSNFDDWKQDFMLLLIEKYKKFTETNELKPTKNMLEWFKQYQEDNNIY